MLQITKLTIRSGDADYYNASDATHDLHLTVENGKVVRIVNNVTERALSSKAIVALVEKSFNAYLDSKRSTEVSVPPANPEAKYIVVQNHAEDGTRYLRSTPHPYGTTDQWVEEPERATLFTKRVAEIAVDSYCPKRHPGYVARAWVVVSADDGGFSVTMENGRVSCDIGDAPTPLPRNIAEDVLTSVGGNFKMQEL